MSRRYLLDTYVVVNLRTKKEFAKLPAWIRRILEDSQNQLLLSSISEMEIAVNHSLSKLNYPKQELAATCSNGGIDFLPFEQHHAREMFDLPLYHRDPFDRALIATAIVEGMPLLSPDREFTRYERLNVVWG